MKNIYTEIKIMAPQHVVWQMLTTFSDYSRWNPFITQIVGTPAMNSQLAVQISPANKSPMKFKPVITVLEEDRELRWLGRFIMPGIFDGEHIFKLEKIDDQSTRFIQTENFSGLLVPFFYKSIADSTKQGFERMNLALKQVCETVV